MSAAQNQGPATSDMFTELLHAGPGRVLDLIAALPQWLQVVLASVLVAKFCLPSLLRALDDHLFNRKARQKITRGSDWVEVLRIRNEPRRFIGRRPTSAPAKPDDPPDAASDTDAEDEPP